MSSIRINQWRASVVVEVFTINSKKTHTCKDQFLEKYVFAALQFLKYKSICEYQKFGGFFS